MPHLLSNSPCLANQNPRLGNGGLGHTIQITQISAALHRMHSNQTTCSLYPPEQLSHQRLSVRTPFLPSVTTTYHELIPAHPQCHEHSAPRPPIQCCSTFSYLCGPRQSQELLPGLQMWGVLQHCHSGHAGRHLRNDAPAVVIPWPVGDADIPLFNIADNQRHVRRHEPCDLESRL